MTRFIALLAVVSGLLLVEAKACDRPAPIELVELKLNYLKVKTIRLRGVRARAYLSIINSEPPATNFTADEILIGVGPDKVSVAAITGDTVCTSDFMLYPHALHNRALIAADRSSI